MRFSLFRIPVVVRPFFWLAIFLLGMPRDGSPDQLARTAMWIGIVFVSVLVHELGHAFAMRMVGREPSIELWGWGGLTHWGDGPSVSGWKRAAVSLAGPFAGFALAVPVVIAAIVVPRVEGSLLAEAIDQALWVNIGWGILNLLPILPLDGGHVMEVALTGVLGSPRGPQAARVLTIGIAALVAFAAFSYEMPLAGMFALMFGMRAFGELRRPLGDASVPARAKASPEVERAIDEAWQAIRSGRSADAITACEDRLAALPDDASDAAQLAAPTRARLLETIAWAHLEAGEDGEALRTARRMPAKYQPSPLLAGRLMIAEGKLAEGLDMLERAYLTTPGDLPALVLASARIDHGEPERAVTMLKGVRGMQVSSSAHVTISAALFYADEFERSFAVCELAWNRFREPTHAYNAACALARLGRIEEGLDRIARAVGAGFADTEKLETDPDLAPLRADPRFPTTTAISAPRPR